MRTLLHLFELIKEMTPHEKRYFKLFSAQNVIGDKNNNLRLFDALNAREHYDEQAIKEHLREEKIGEHLAVLRSRLYDMILESLRAYRVEKSKVRQLGDLIENAEILSEKALHDQARKLIAKAYAQAERQENLHAMLRLLELKRLDVIDTFTKSIHEQLDDIATTTRRLLRQLDNVEAFYNLYYLLFARLRSENRPADDELLREIEDNDLLAAPDRALTKTALLRYHYIHAMLARARGDRLRIYREWQTIVALLRENRDLLCYSLPAYLIAAANFVNVCLALGHNDEARETIGQLKEMRDTGSLTRHTLIELNHNIHHLELMHCLNTGAIDRGLALAPAIREWMDVNAPKINHARYLAIYYNLAILYFISGSYQSAYDCFTLIAESDKSPARVDLQGRARLLICILLFEVGKSELLESKVRAAQYFLKKYLLLGSFEKGVLAFAKKYAVAVDSKERRMHCEALQSQLRAILDLPQEDQHHTPCLRELLCWLESTLLATPIKQVFIQRHQTRFDYDSN